MLTWLILALRAWWAHHWGSQIQNVQSGASRAAGSLIIWFLLLLINSSAFSQRVPCPVHDPTAPWGFIRAELRIYHSPQFVGAWMRECSSRFKTLQIPGTKLSGSSGKAPAWLEFSLNYYYYFSSCESSAVYLKAQRGGWGAALAAQSRVRLGQAPLSHLTLQLFVPAQHFLLLEDWPFPSSLTLWKKAES